MPSPLINVTIPAHNEERVLVANVEKLRGFLAARLQGRFEIVIAENGSTDGTLSRADELAARFGDVRVLHSSAGGRGGALKRAWTDSGADVFTYMDCDLSTDLDAFPALVEAVALGRSDLAVGSRLLPSSQTTRGLKRELISRGYNLLVRTTFRTNLSDFQCGFKAISRCAALALLPQVEDREWFFDTELLLLAVAHGYRVMEFPVRWVEEPASHVSLWRTAVADVRGLLRVKRRLRGLRPSGNHGCALHHGSDGKAGTGRVPAE